MEDLQEGRGKERQSVRGVISPPDTSATLIEAISSDKEVLDHLGQKAVGNKKGQ